MSVVAERIPESPVVALNVRIVSGAGGGPEKMILASPRHFEGTPFREMAAYLHSPSNRGIEVIRRRAAENGCPFIPIADHGKFDVRVVDRMAQLCRALGVRIWHGHDYKSNFLGLLLRDRLGLRLVSTVHGWAEAHSPKARMYYALDRWCLRRYERVICVSPDLFDACERSGVPRERLRLVENGIDTASFRRTRSPADARGCATRRGRLVIGAVGRLSYEKGYDLLIPAVDRLVEEGHDVELWIAGEGPQRAELAACIARARHRERFRLLGFVDDLHHLFESFDVFALSSRNEGLPLALLEAMAMEVPVVATRCGGVAGVVENGECGVLAETNSIEDLAAGLRKVLACASLREQLATRARRRVVDGYSLAHRMERVREIYEELGG